MTIPRARRIALGLKESVCLKSLWIFGLIRSHSLVIPLPHSIDGLDPIARHCHRPGALTGHAASDRPRGRGNPMNQRSLMVWAGAFLTGLALTGCSRNQCCSNGGCCPTGCKGPAGVPVNGPAQPWNQPPQAGRPLSSSPVMSQGKTSTPASTVGNSTTNYPATGRMATPGQVPNPAAGPSSSTYGAGLPNAPRPLPVQPMPPMGAGGRPLETNTYSTAPPSGDLPASPGGQLPLTRVPMPTPLPPISGGDTGGIPENYVPMSPSDAGSLPYNR